MKYAYQVMIIGGISLAGELLNYLLPLPVPASSIRHVTVVDLSLYQGH